MGSRHHLGTPWNIVVGSGLSSRTENFSEIADAWHPTQRNLTNFMEHVSRVWLVSTGRRIVVFKNACHSLFRKLSRNLYLEMFYTSPLHHVLTFGSIYLYARSKHILVLIMIVLTASVVSSQSSWLQIQRSRVWFAALPCFLRRSESATGSTQPREYNWGATGKRK
jgi:hypothetical protein